MLAVRPRHCYLLTCKLTNCPSLSFFIYEMELIIPFHRLSGGVKDNAHSTLCINLPGAVATGTPPLCSFALVWLQLTSCLAQPPGQPAQGLLCWALCVEADVLPENSEECSQCPGVPSRWTSHRSPAQARPQLTSSHLMTPHPVIS